MKREILFRGRYAREKAWVYGSLIAEHGILDNDEHGGMLHPIDFNTVGQYTGLKDALGRKIFEGDIFATGDCMMFVTFKGGEFVLEGTVNGKTKRYPMTACYDDKEITEIDFIVIGNIYDNPELIGGDEC